MACLYLVEFVSKIFICSLIFFSIFFFKCIEILCSSIATQSKNKDFSFPFKFNSMIFNVQQYHFSADFSSVVCIFLAVCFEHFLQSFSPFLSFLYVCLIAIVHSLKVIVITWLFPLFLIRLKFCSFHIFFCHFSCLVSFLIDKYSTFFFLLLFSLCIL